MRARPVVAMATENNNRRASRDRRVGDSGLDVLEGLLLDWSDVRQRGSRMPEQREHGISKEEQRRDCLAGRSSRAGEESVSTEVTVTWRMKAECWRWMEMEIHCQRRQVAQRLATGLAPPNFSEIPYAKGTDKGPGGSGTFGLCLNEHPKPR